MTQMLPRNPDQAQANRLRSAAPLAALAGPLLLVAAAAINVLLPCAGGGCLTLERRSLVLLAAGAPAFPAIVALPGELPLVVSILAGAGASVPLWTLVGRQVAERTVARGGGWRQFWRRYGAVFGAWCVVAVIAAVVMRNMLG